MYPVTIKVKGRTYSSVEHAFQAQKCNDPEWLNYCENPDNDGKKIKVKSRTVDLRPNWDSVKLLVMEHCLRLKFNQEPFKEALKLTGNQNIQEGNHWKDVFWGVDLKQNPNIGENHLGRLIMKIREELK
jgi:hypothetical protein